LMFSEKTIREAVRYLFVGVSSALIELLLFFALDSFVALDVRMANPLAVSCATVYNYILNRSFTFSSTENTTRSMVLYALLFLFNQLFSTTVIFIAVNHGLISMYAKLATMMCVVAWNFVLYRKVVFK